MQKTTFPAVLATFLVSFAFWILLTWSFAAEELIVGAVVSLLVALFSARFFIHEKSFWFAHPGRLFAGIGYWLFIFPVELIKANCDMARRCYGGCRDVNPGIVKVPVELKSNYGQAALANSITLTPGTITLDIAEEGDSGKTWYYIHWIDVETADPEAAGEAIKGRLERGLRRVWE